MSEKAIGNPNDTVIDNLRKSGQNQKNIISRTLLDGFKKDLLNDVSKAIPDYNTPIPAYDMKCVESLLDKITPDEFGSFIIHVGGHLKNFFERLLFPKTGNNKDLKNGYKNLIKAAESEKKLSMDISDILKLNIPLKVHSLFSNISNAFTDWISSDDTSTGNTIPSPIPVLNVVQETRDSRPSSGSVASVAERSSESPSPSGSVASVA